MKSRILYYPASLILLLCFLVMPCLVSHAAEVSDYSATGSIDTSTLNVRSGPSKDDEMLGTLESGAQVTITGKTDGWYRIDYQGKVGYVAQKYVSVKESAPAPSIEQTEIIPDDDLPAGSSFLSGFSPATLLIAGIIAVIILVIVTSMILLFRKNKEEDEEEDDDEEELEEDDDEEELEEDDEEEEFEDDALESEDEDDDEEIYSKKLDSKKKYTAQKAVVQKETENRTNPVQKTSPVARTSDNPDDYRVYIDPIYFKEEDSVSPSPEDIEEIDRELIETAEKIAALQKKVEQLKHQKK